MATKAQIKAQSKYDKQHTRQLLLKLNISSDADILAKLQRENNKQGYIKALVREDMRNTDGILTKESIRDLLLPITNKYNIKSLSLFGSYARGEATPESDVDILIDGGTYTGLVEYMTMIDDMKKALGRDVDVITQSSLDGSSSKADLLFKSNLEKDRIILI